jgi:hypothetical protein
MRIATALAGLVACMAGCTTIEGDRSAFVGAPTAQRKEYGAEIRFQLSRAADVEVAILDAKGKTVRHLAAGLLGKNAPKPLKPGTLEQNVFWDGTDDTGRPVPAGRYRAEICVGLSPTLDRVLGYDPYDVGHIHGLAVGPNGDLYVMGGVGRETRGGCFRVFDENGKYRRTILPRPGSLPLDRVKPLGEVVLDNGEHFPLTLFPQYGSRTYQTPVVAPNGDLIFLNGGRSGSIGQRFHGADAFRSYPRQLLRVAADGGASENGSEGPVLGREFYGKMADNVWAGGKHRTNLDLFLALGPDGETVYISGSPHAIFKVKWGPKEKPTLVAGTPGKAGSGANGLTDPCGIAVDAGGRLYVADRGNHRIACFDAAGKLAGEIPVEWPRQIAVHPNRRTIYVTAGFKKQKLLRFADLRTPKPTAELDLNSPWPFIALDARKHKPVVYVGNIESEGHGRAAVKSVVRFVDEADRFVAAGVVTRGREPFQPYLMGVDRKRERVYGIRRRWGPYVHWDPETGNHEVVHLPISPTANQASEMTVGPDGTVAFHATREFGRIDPHLLPDPFDHSGTFMARLWGDDCVRGSTDRGCCVAADGSLYHVHQRGGHGSAMRVRAVNADGSIRKDSLIVFEGNAAAAIRSDRAGNVYVLADLKPLDQPVPPAFEGKTRITRHNPVVYNYGSLFKFPPTGGRVRMLSKGLPKDRKLEPGQMQFTVAEGIGDYLCEGALWSWYGASMIQPILTKRGHSDCLCWVARFDLDAFDRVFVPDQMRCRIVVLDTNGNVITSFGRYGNADDPGIALADPRTVMVSQDAAYVGDMTNNRIVRVRLDYAARASCTLTVSEQTLGQIARRQAEAGEFAQRRKTLRLLNASVRVREVREEARTFCPSLDRNLDWRAVEDDVLRQSSTALANADDARAVLAIHAARNATDWHEGNARALFGEYVKSGNAKLRLWVAWALCGRELGGPGHGLLQTLLEDKNVKVRLAAAYALLDYKDTAGLRVVFSSLLDDDEDVRKLAIAAFRVKMKELGPDYRIDDAAVAALDALLLKAKLEDRHWYIRKTALLLLGRSDNPRAAAPLLRSLRTPEIQRNLNRCITGLGQLRSREAVPDIVKYLARGRCPEWGTTRYNGDAAERCAADALVKIGDPKSVGPIIELLDSKKDVVAPFARRTLERMFDPDAPADVCLAPRGAKLVRVRIDKLPAPGELKAAWQAFWKAHGPDYVWNPEAGPLVRRSH